MSSLTDEDDQQQTNGSQLNVGVTEGVAEGGVDDQEEDSAAHSAKRRLSPLQELSHQSPTHLQTQRRCVSTASRRKRPPGGREKAYLTEDQRNHHGHEELREDGGEGNRGRGSELEEGSRSDQRTSSSNRNEGEAHRGGGIQPK